MYALPLLHYYSISFIHQATQTSQQSTWGVPLLPHYPSAAVMAAPAVAMAAGCTSSNRDGSPLVAVTATTTVPATAAVAVSVTAATAVVAATVMAAPAVVAATVMAAPAAVAAMVMAALAVAAVAVQPL
jgi:hypothetical protein